MFGGKAPGGGLEKNRRGAGIYVRVDELVVIPRLQEWNGVMLKFLQDLPHQEAVQEVAELLVRYWFNATIRAVSTPMRILAKWQRRGVNNELLKRVGLYPLSKYERGLVVRALWTLTTRALYYGVPRVREIEGFERVGPLLLFEEFNQFNQSKAPPVVNVESFLAVWGRLLGPSNDSTVEGETLRKLLSLFPNGHLLREYIGYLSEEELNSWHEVIKRLVEGRELTTEEEHMWHWFLGLIRHDFQQVGDDSNGHFVVSMNGEQQEVSPSRILRAFLDTLLRVEPPKVPSDMWRREDNIVGYPFAVLRYPQRVDIFTPQEDLNEFEWNLLCAIIEEFLRIKYQPKEIYHHMPSHK